ncbi:sensor histidine kinase [Solirubrobacter soli]|uniref:sensor histidine kinase n=1 Tax=Solirubrobacter soli TaxID=363832 RepID=UPI000407DA22|nr:histidine kinase [Solirubrobacter soli]
MPRVIAALTVLVTVALAAVGLTSDHDDAPLGPVLLVAFLTPASVGLFVALRRPGNVVAWILQLGALSVSVVMLASVVASAQGETTLGLWAATVAAPWPVLFLWPLALAFVFPDGGLPSPRWRPVAWAVSANSALIVILLILAPTHLIGDRDVPNPLPHLPASLEPLFWVCWGGLLASLFAGALALRARYKAGDELLRRQVLWLAYGALLIPVWFGGTSLLGVIGLHSDATDIVTLTLLQAWPAVAVAIAITRHGLYSIDRLFNRTLVYATLTVLLVGTYALGSLLIGQLVGESKLTASLATIAAALAFLPLRDRLQTLVDRRFARRRFDAVRMLRDFLDEVRDGHAEPEDVGAVIALALDDRDATLVFQLPESGRFADRNGHAVELPDDGRERSVIGRDLGVLVHEATAPDLLHGVLGAAAVPVELARLRVELRLQLAEVESSRARIAQAGYEERRRLERDLHDGAQQRLVTLGIVLRRLQRSLPREAQMLVPALDAAVAEVAASIADLRTIAAGVRPPRLDEGLAAALADLARGAAVPVDVTATPDRAPPEVEATAYFVACEALTNAVKHGSPSRVVVETLRTDGVLRMTIADDGIGGAVAVPGMQDRVAAQGGTLAIVSPPGEGTRIAVELPCGS